MSDGGRVRLTIFQAAAVDDERLGNAAFRVLACLGSYTDSNGWAFPSQSTLAKRLRISRQAVNKSLQQLADLGYITIHHQHGNDGAMRSCRYQLCFAGVQPDVAGVQPDVDAPATSEVAPPATYHVAPPATSEVAHNVPIERSKKERPRGTDVDVQFARFWSIYPKRKKRQECLAWFKREQPDAELVDTMIAAVERSAMSGDWQKEGGRYIPLPDTWLRGRRWEDEDEIALPIPNGTPRLELVGRDKDRAESIQRTLLRRQNYAGR